MRFERKDLRSFYYIGQTKRQLRRLTPRASRFLGNDLHHEAYLLRSDRSECVIDCMERVLPKAFCSILGHHHGLNATLGGKRIFVIGRVESLLEFDRLYGREESQALLNVPTHQMIYIYVKLSDVAPIRSDLLRLIRFLLTSIPDRDRDHLSEGPGPSMEALFSWCEGGDTRNRRFNEYDLREGLYSKHVQHRNVALEARCESTRQKQDTELLVLNNYKRSHFAVAAEHTPHLVVLVGHRMSLLHTSWEIIQPDVTVIDNGIR